jgi:hypothetical protein
LGVHNRASVFWLAMQREAVMRVSSSVLVTATLLGANAPQMVPRDFITLPA